MTQSPAERDAGTWGALFGLGFVVIGLLGLVAMVVPHLLRITLVVAGFVGFGALHYLIWGWWLGQTLKDEPGDSDLEDSETPSGR